MTSDERQTLINAIALREGTARELADRFETTPEALREFVADNKPAIEAALRRFNAPEPPIEPATLDPNQLEDLWITNKFERLKRLQAVADETYKSIVNGTMSTAEQAIVVREFRSYLMLAANELGQLLHRGSGEGSTGDSLSIDIQGIDMGNLQ